MNSSKKIKKGQVAPVNWADVQDKPTVLNGKSVLNGVADPAPGDGVDGDFWINTATNEIFGPKAGGVWGAGVSLIGPEGPAGVDGQDGAQGIQGEPGLPGADGQDGAQGIQGEPGLPGADGQDGAQGIQGEPGLPGADGQDGAQGPQGLQGDPGPAGADGQDGAQGIQGEPGLPGADGQDGSNGKTVLNGVVDPAPGDGVDGDFWINTATAEIFGPKAGGAWGAGTSIVGPQGPAGSDGADGADGSGLWSATGNNISNDNSGNVGIGTSSPETKLHVHASGAFTGPAIRMKSAGNEYVNFELENLGVRWQFSARKAVGNDNNEFWIAAYFSGVWKNVAKFTPSGDLNLLGALTVGNVWKLPTVAGTNGQVLKTNGVNTAAWSDAYGEAQVKGTFRVFSKGQATLAIILTSAPSINWNLKDGNKFYLELNHDAELRLPLNEEDQDATILIKNVGQNVLTFQEAFTRLGASPTLVRDAYILIKYTGFKSRLNLIEVINL